MARHKSTEKRERQAQKKRLMNRSVKSKIRTLTRHVIEALEKGDTETARKALAGAVPAIDKAGGKGIFHKKAASRKVSRLVRKVSAAKA
ncbi:MAG: 30S ribosomal protein S20 [Nitrospirae bacterium RBG_16_64_22]|nr:MAG: 30S ribosomal protein S20 [Nitrospirae bacterium RBG_16_64_22]